MQDLCTGGGEILMVYLSKVKPKSCLPTVTAIIPVYNGEDYIIEALNSVLNQTHQPDEILVVDDASTDKTLAIVKKYSKSPEAKMWMVEKGFGRFFTIITSKKNGGIGAARRTGCDLATGDYIAFCSADDQWAPTFIEEMLRAASRNKDAVLYSDYMVVDEHNRQLYEFKALGFEAHEDFCLRAWEQAYRDTMWVNFSCVFIPKKVFEAVKFDKTLRVGEDLKFMLLAMRDFKFKRVEKTLLRYMVHSKSSTQTKTPELLVTNIKTRVEAEKWWLGKHGRETDC